MARVEMGQGIYTSLAMLIAEELEVPLSQVKFAHAPADTRYGNPLAGGWQITGGSNSIRGAWEPMRLAGATARVMLVEAAAQTWGATAQAASAEDVDNGSAGDSLGLLRGHGLHLAPRQSSAARDHRLTYRHRMFIPSIWRLQPLPLHHPCVVDSSWVV